MKAGQGLITLSGMKMETSVAAPCTGTFLHARMLAGFQTHLESYSGAWRCPFLPNFAGKDCFVLAGVVRHVAVDNLDAVEAGKPLFEANAQNCSTK